MENSRAVYLFRRYFDQKATAEERTELMVWIDKDENEERIKELMDKAWDEFYEPEKVFENEKSEEMLRSVLEEHLKVADIQKSLKKARLRIIWARAAAAAILAMLIAGGYLWVTTTELPGGGKITHNLQMKNDVAPGGDKATLTLANGKTIILDSVHTGQLADQGNSKVVKLNSGQLVYKVQGASPSAGREGQRAKSSLVYNTLAIPRGGQYQLLLPDGSKVWLNAASSIRFPTAFTGNERKVEITGEAYFEIAQNAAMPFIVQAEGVSITVLGTHFNVNAYQDDAGMKVTLVEGRVKVATKNGEGTILKPMEQLQVNKEAQVKLVKNADVGEAVAWKNGLFQFDGDDIATIMRKISRWYDVAVTYESGIPPGHFTGVISRNTNLSEVLKMLELSGVQFKIDGKDLIVL